MLLLFLFVSWSGNSQNLQKEINRQVWQVQLEAMNAKQADKFMFVMSEDVVTVSYSRKTIRSNEQFSNQDTSTYKELLKGS
jgi:hypothetical protein